MVRFDEAPKKLYFSFDAKFKSVQFNDQYLAEQMELNERLQAEKNEREAEINRLRTLLTKTETDLKDALSDSEVKFRIMEAEKGETEKLLGEIRKDNAARLIQLEDLQKMVEASKDELRKMEAEKEEREKLLGEIQKESTGLIDQVKDYQKIVEDLKNEVLATRAFRKDPELQRHFTGESRHLIVKNFDTRMTLQDIKVGSLHQSPCSGH